MLKYKQRQKKTLNHKNESILKLTILSKKIMNKLCSHLNSQIPKCRKRKKEKKSCPFESNYGSYPNGTYTYRENTTWVVPFFLNLIMTL